MGLTLKKIVMPTVPKIALYAAMVFAVPGMLKLCSDGCINKIVLFAGYRLILNPGQYTLTFPRMLLLFATAYIASVAIIGGVNLFRRKRGWARKEKV